MTAGGGAVLDVLEGYYDAAPRSLCRVERHGPLALFVATGGPPGWRYYARPALGAGPVGADDVRRVRSRQRQLGEPEDFEWIDEVTPSMTDAARGAGLAVRRVPLLVHDPSAAVEPRPVVGAEVRLLAPDAPDLAAVSAAVGLGFAEPGTAVGATGTAALRDRMRVEGKEWRVAPIRSLMRRGLTVTVAAYVDGEPVAGGSHLPRGTVSEVAGVATLSAYRRRGLAAAVTALLVADARGRGCATVFLSAASEEVARIYAGVGFRPVGHACTASPA